MATWRQAGYRLAAGGGKPFGFALKREGVGSLGF